MSKTGRIYGTMVKAIRDMAATGKEFCVCDFDNPENVRRMLSKLVKNGEVKRVIQGRGGKAMTIYQKV